MSIIRALPVAARNAATRPPPPRVAGRPTVSLPARYVSGYLFHTERLDGQAAGHAWAEVLVVTAIPFALMAGFGRVPEVFRSRHCGSNAP
ncbi:MAG: hypothetical protein RLO48_02965 [Bauldia litoralis]